MAVRFHLPSKVYGHDNADLGVERGNIVSWRQEVGRALAGQPLAFGATIDSRGPKWGWLAVGLTQTALILVAQHLTGAAANPARWLGTVVWEWTLSSNALLDHATYWIGPIIGALLAGGGSVRVAGVYWLDATLASGWA